MSEDVPAYGPPPIKGYRKLTQAEVDAVNMLKDVEANVLAHLATLAADVGHYRAGEGGEAIPVPGADARALAIAKTHIQTGFMWANRSILKPEDL